MAAVGRYALQGVIGKGGAATVHLAKLIGDGRFERVVAVKRLHPDVAKDELAVAAFVDEARLASRIQSAHVVPTLDVVVEDGEVLLVMDYVAGETLARLIIGAARGGGDLPIAVVVGIVADVLRGLAVAHAAKAEEGTPLRLVHRDVSPQNVLVGTDGIARILDFGIAKAVGRAQRTRTGIVKGKLGYMPPEQLLGNAIDARADLYAVGVVAWEALTSERLFPGDEEGVVDRILAGDIAPPSSRRADVTPELDAVIVRALARDADDRFATANDMLAALEAAAPRATTTEIADLVATVASESLATRAKLVEECERAFVETTTIVAPPARPRRARRAKAMIAVAALGVALFVVAGVTFLGKTRRSSPEMIPSVSPSPLASAETAPPDDEPATSSSAVAPRSRMFTKTKPRPATTARDKCNPPYVIDSEGHKQWKRECF